LVDVAVETEIKLRIIDRESFRDRLVHAGGRPRRERHFEDNFVFDFADGRLRQSSVLLRIRSTDELCTVTYKGAPRPAGPFKQREELEFTAGDKASCLQIFRRLGLEVWFRYQKFREEFEMSCDAGTVHVAVDDTPIGGFAEIEGAEAAIREVASTLGFAESDFLKESYYTLYQEECRKAGLVPADMVFPDAIM
jgi:predicted adenylyl cyclase CyaB